MVALVPCFRCRTQPADPGRLYCPACRRQSGAGRTPWRPCLPLSAYGDTGEGLTRADVAAEVSKQLAPVRRAFADLRTAQQSQAADVRDLKALADWLEARVVERDESEPAEVQAGSTPAAGLVGGK